MKGFLVFMLAMLVVASFAFAGVNESYIDQVGTANVATVDQADGPNLSNITQGTVGPFNASTGGTATVNQSAANNDSEIDQKGWNNTADVDQSGDSNDSNIDQYGMGTAGSTATVDQNGDYDYSDIEQWNGPQAGNTATVTQGGDDGAEDYNHTSEIYQAGGLHTATVTQYGMDEESYVDQVGTGNTATVNQSGNSFNDSWVDQNGLNNTAEVDQIGNENDAHITQGVGADNNFGAIDQTDEAELNQAFIAQSGDGNETRIVQKDGANMATFNSMSDNNGTRDLITDGYTEGNIILQEGAGNTATVNQYAAMGAGNNTAWISQDDDDTAIVTQTGYGSDAYVNQQ